MVSQQLTGGFPTYKIQDTRYKMAAQQDYKQTTDCRRHSKSKHLNLYILVLVLHWIVSDSFSATILHSDMEVQSSQGSVSSHASDLGEDELVNIVQSAQSECTTRSTKWNMKKFQDWITKGKVTFDFQTITVE